MSIKLRKKYSPLYYGYPSQGPEYFELRWDVIGCILGCDFCYSPASRPKQTNDPTVEMNPAQIFRKTISNIEDPAKSFIRFTGGEPTIYWDDLLQVFEFFAKDEALVNVPILIQTNGISIGKGGIDLYRLSSEPLNKLKFIFELSIKGTNSEEFEILTRTSKYLYGYQLMAYHKFKMARKHNRNLSFVTVLGVYHSSIKGKRSKFVFVYPLDGIPMFDKHKPWDKEFEKVWEDSERKWVESLRMSPKGMWENVLERCGDEGAKILKYYPDGISTNPDSIFPAKPRGYEYACGLVNNYYW
jgi:uncharacterized Fe-S cluster-containing radical SAM superfamily protein